MQAAIFALNDATKNNTGFVCRLDIKAGIKLRTTKKIPRVIIYRFLIVCIKRESGEVKRIRSSVYRKNQKWEMKEMVDGLWKKI